MIKIEICDIIKREITLVDYEVGDEIPNVLLEYPVKGLSLFIDPSTTSLGMSIAYTKKKVPMFGIGVKRGNSNLKEIFVEEFGMFLNKLLQTLDFELVVAEDQYIDRRRYEAYAALKMVMGKISSICVINGVKMEKIKPTAWKGVVLDMYPGNVDKRKSNKKEVKSVMVKIIPATLAIKTIDVFDSLGIMFYYMTKVIVDEASYRKDLPVMMYTLANGVDHESYENMYRNTDKEAFNNSAFDYINDSFYNKKNGEIVKITKSTTKEYKKNYYVEIIKIRAGSKTEFLRKVTKEIEKTFEDQRSLDYVIFDQDLSITDNAMGYMGTKVGRIGFSIIKPNSKNLMELFWGRDLLGKLTKDDYIFVKIRR